MKSIFTLVCFSLIVLFVFIFALAKDSLTSTTYYPSPKGAYNETQANILELKPRGTALVGIGGVTVSCPVKGQIAADPSANLFVCKNDPNNPSALVCQAIVKPPQCVQHFSLPPAHITGEAYAYCDANEYLLGGGGYCDAPANQIGMLVGSEPIPDPAGWTTDCAGYTRPGNSTIQLQVNDTNVIAHAFAVCCK